MAKLLKQAIQDVRSFYIRKLINDGTRLDEPTLSSYTISELKKEYTLVMKKERK